MDDWSIQTFVMILCIAVAYNCFSFLKLRWSFNFIRSSNNVQ